MYLGLAMDQGGPLRSTSEKGVPRRRRTDSCYSARPGSNHLPEHILSTEIPFTHLPRALVTHRVQYNQYK